MRLRNTILLFAVQLIAFQSAFASSKGIELDAVHGKDLLTGAEQSIEIKRGADQATVVVFLSTKCMCSAEQLMSLKELARAQGSEKVRFAVVNVDAFDPDDKKQAHYKAINLGLPVLKDEGLKMARAFKVQKTPHAFLIDGKGEIVFEGGVSDSNDDKEMPYLADAIEDFAKKRPLRKSKAVTFGCAVRYQPIN